jgi:hypothetical protein
LDRTKLIKSLVDRYPSDILWGWNVKKRKRRGERYYEDIDEPLLIRMHNKRKIGRTGALKSTTLADYGVTAVISIMKHPVGVNLYPLTEDAVDSKWYGALEEVLCHEIGHHIYKNKLLHNSDAYQEWF